MAKNVYALITDLFFKAKLQEILDDINIIFIENSDDIREESNLIICDLSNTESYQLIQKFPKKTICFYSHKNIEELKKAKESGCGHVYPRSVFFRKVKGLLS